MGFKGNLVSANAAVSSYSSSSGIWKSSEQIQAQFAGTWPNSPNASYTIEYLLIAGGGSGNDGYINAPEIPGGGGGAGGLLYGTTSILSGVNFPIVIGAGGAWTFVENNSPGGSNSTFNSLTAIRGGGGGKQSRAGESGGSGGGGGANASGGGSGTAGQGNPGGNGGAFGSYVAGGGGGSGGSGSNPSAGAGTSYSISGSAITYAAGGQGGTQNSGHGSPGTANRGNGGGGGQQGQNITGGNGGSGVAIIKYAGSQRASGGTVTSSGGYTIHTFNSSSNFIS